MKPNNFRIPVVTERKVTADELYLQALTSKHECIIGYVNAGCNSLFIPMKDCREKFDAAIEHYKKLAWKEER